MSWFTKFFLDPIEKAVKDPNNTSTPALIATAKTTAATATQAVDPIFSEAVTGIEAIADTALSKAGVAGQIGTPAANMFIQMLATALHSALDAKLGITSTFTPTLAVQQP